jgi:hypothetical protein
MPAQDPHNSRRPRSARLRAPHAWVAPLISTLITLPAAFCAGVYVLLASMNCDSCSRERLAEFDASFHPAFLVFAFGLPVPLILLILLIVSWSLPWQRRHNSRRTTLAVLAPACALTLFALFMSIVNWPAA